MMDYINQCFFGLYPYVCLAVFVIGSILRFEHSQYSWRSGSSQLLRRRQLVLGSVLFHVGVLVIFAGHFVGLLTPIPTLGQSFDPNRHVAVATDTSGRAAEGIIVAEDRRGYTTPDKVLRYAEVVVARIK
jgi:respiratory nitrate reductase gamma subunit